MATMEIDRPQWKAFFDSFTRRHEGWLVTLEVLSSDIGDQIELKDLPLQGITAETNGADSIEIVVTNERAEHLSHSIDRPLHVWCKQSESGADEVLEIVTDEGATLVYFRSAMPPVTVDGM